MPAFAELVGFLGGVLQGERFAGGDDPAGNWRAGERPVATVGLALAPWPGIGGWLAAAAVDALVLHRPWRLAELAGSEVERLGVGVLAYHLAFDERLTIGANPWLAAALGLSRPEMLGRKEGRPLGMIGDVAEQAASSLVDTIEREFGGLEAVLPGPAAIERVAVVGAMTAALVEEAARRGAGLYLTGQVRQPALTAVAATRIGVVAVGHDRAEAWGLRALAGLLGERWPGLRIVIAPAS